MRKSLVLTLCLAALLVGCKKPTVEPAPKGPVGAVPAPIPVVAFLMITGQKSLSGSPLGAPATTRKMLEFCARHGIETVTEHFPMSQCNEALAHLESGKARYRIVLDNA